ncbi:hypothetical protein NFJ02_24g54600 [Pycnococcus provasolii]
MPRIGAPEWTQAQFYLKKTADSLMCVPSVRRAGAFLYTSGSANEELISETMQDTSVKHAPNIVDGVPTNSAFLAAVQRRATALASTWEDAFLGDDDSALKPQTAQVHRRDEVVELVLLGGTAPAREAVGRNKV